MSTALAERTTSQELSPAAKQKQRLDAFMGAIEKRSDQVETLLSDSGIDPKLFIEGCRRALMRDAELVNTSPASFIQSAMNCAADGLVPDGRKAAIVRYKGAAQYMPMYQGLLDIAYRSCNFQSIEAHVVYEGDEFDFALGDKPFIHHKPTLETDTSKIRGAYAVARTTNGGVFREVMGKRELDKVRAMSKAASGPNKDWPGEMARKAPLRRLWKYLPRTPAMDRIAEHDDQTYDHSAIPANDGPKLAPGFAAPALAAKVDEPQAQDAEFTDALDGDTIPSTFGGPVPPDAPDGPPEAEQGDDTPRPPADATTEPFTRAVSGEATEPKSDAEVEDDDFEPIEWAAYANERIDKADTVADLDEFTSQPKTVDAFTRLSAESPMLAKTLDATLRGRRKAMAAKEAAQAEAGR